MNRNARQEARQDCNLADPGQAQAFEREAIVELRRSGLRVTTPRVHVIRALSQSNCAMSPYEIHGIIQAAGAKVDVVSVYRILQALMETGLVHRIGVLDGYYACRAGIGHGEDMEHYVCRACGCVQELPSHSDTTGRLATQSRSLGFRMEAVHVEVLGTCAHCMAERG